VPAFRKAELGEGLEWGRAKSSVTASASRLPRLRLLLSQTPHFDPTSPDTTSAKETQQKITMADIKALKDAVWLKKEEIKKEEQGLSDWKAQVRIAQSVVFK
jgi:hypothetical protein